MNNKGLTLRVRPFTASAGSYPMGQIQRESSSPATGR
jgi:hypothetical protein